MSATIRTEKAALVAALTTLSRVVERRNTIPILSNVLFSAIDGQLCLSSTDLDLVVTIPVKSEGVADFTVAAHLLHDIVRKMPDGAEVLLELDEKGGRVKLVSGRSRFSLQCLPASDFPLLNAGKFSHNFQIAGPHLAQILKTCAFAISNEETRYYLNGIYLHCIESQGDTVLRAVATDGHRLARCQIDAPSGSETMPGVIVPRKTIGELIKMSEANDTLEISLSDSKLQAKAAGVTLVSKLIDGTFPDYQRVIPSGNDILFDIDKANLASAADRVATISTERGRAVKLTFEGDTLTLSVNNPDSGSATEQLAVEGDHTTDIGFNAKYLAEALAHLAGDTVTMALASPGSPALLTAKADSDTLIVLMPMRV